MMVRPTCDGSGAIEPQAPVPLTPMEFRVWNAVRRSKYGIDADGIVRQVYSDDLNGGPLHARTCIYLAIRRANARLAAAGQKIVSSNRNRGSIYRIQHIGIATANTAPADHLGTADQTTQR
jgi:hypothetical protein